MKRINDNSKRIAVAMPTNVKKPACTAIEVSIFVPTLPLSYSSEGDFTLSDHFLGNFRSEFHKLVGST